MKNKKERMGLPRSSLLEKALRENRLRTTLTALSSPKNNK